MRSTYSLPKISGSRTPAEMQAYQNSKEQAVSMAFCGQCGILLPHEAITTCPRCHSLVTSRWESADPNANAATFISTSDKTQLTEISSHSKPELVQEPNQLADFHSETQTVEQGKNIPTPPTPQSGTFPGYYTQAPYPPPDSRPQTNRYFPQTQEAFSPDNPTTQQPLYPSSVFSPDPSYPPPASPHKTKIWTRLSVFLLIFLVAITMTTLIVGPNRLLQMVRRGPVAPQITPLSPTFLASTPVPVLLTLTAQPSASPEQQARLVIDHYYSAINNKDYQTAYDLWLNSPDTYQHFANGFADTSSDTYTFGNIAQRSDGTVQVNLTLVATSTSYQQTTYKGYYLVGQQTDGTWKIISAKIS